MAGRNGKVHYSASSFFFLLTINRSGRLVEIRWSVCITKSQRILCVSFSRMDSGLCTHHLFIWSNSNFLHNSQWITFLTQLCLILYSLCTNLLHSLIMWCYSYFAPWEFFASALADGLSLELEWQKVSSNLQDTSQYSGRSQQCCSLYNLNSPCYF